MKASRLRARRLQVLLPKKGKPGKLGRRWLSDLAKCLRTSYDMKLCCQSAVVA